MIVRNHFPMINLSQSVTSDKAEEIEAWIAKKQEEITT